MSTLALEPTLFDRPGGEPSLDELITGVWEVLTARQPVECPICGGSMAAQYGAHSRPIGGRCGDCASELS